MSYHSAQNIPSQQQTVKHYYLVLKLCYVNTLYFTLCTRYIQLIDALQNVQKSFVLRGSAFIKNMSFGVHYIFNYKY